MPKKTIESVLKEHTDELMSLPGVVGTAQGLCDGKPCIKVFMIDTPPGSDNKIPSFLDGYPVEVVKSGEFKALPKE